MKAFDSPERGQIQSNEVEDFLCQIVEFNIQLRAVRHGDAAFRFVKIEMICLVSEVDLKF